MRIHIYGGGKRDWNREVFPVASIDPQERRLDIKGRVFKGVGKGARFFLEDELGFLNAPGEFFVDETAHTLHYLPLGKGHPDTLGISYPVLLRIWCWTGWRSKKPTTRRQCRSGHTMASAMVRLSG
jgi:hypothetical protein